MAKIKRHFKVFCRMIICDETSLSNDVSVGPWEYCGSTNAVSEAAAIRNIKWRRRRAGADLFDEFHPGGSYDRTTQFMAVDQLTAREGGTN